MNGFKNTAGYQVNLKLLQLNVQLICLSTIMSRIQELQFSIRKQALSKTSKQPSNAIKMARSSKVCEEERYDSEY